MVSFCCKISAAFGPAPRNTDEKQEENPMAKDYNKLALDIVANVGGEENVISLTH